MSVVAIIVKIEWEPTEIQEWLDSNPTKVIHHVVSHDNLIYIFYD